MVVTSKHRTHKVMEAAIRELMGAGTPPSFKFKDTHASIEFPSGYTIPSQATLEAKYDELLALEEDIQKTVMEGDLEVGTSNLFVDTQTGNIGIGTNSPIGALDINAGPENDTTPALAIRGGIYDESDLYVLNSYNVNTGVGYAAKVIGVNIKNKVETNNTVKIRDNQGGLTSAGAIYLGSDDENQGIFGVLGATGAAGTTLSEHLTVRAGGNVGIGTASPMNTGLHIANSYFASGGNTTHLNPQIFITGDSGTSGNQVSAIGFSGNSSGDTHQRMVAGSVYYKGGGGNYGMDGYLGIAVANSSTSGTDPYGLTEGELESHTRIAIKNNGNVGIGTTSPGIVLDVGSSLSNPQIGRNYATGSVHDADKRDAIYFGRWDGTGRDFLGIKCRVDTHTALGYGDYSNQTKLEFYTWGNNYASSREVMCIRGDGNVGIGTANPTHQLHIGPKDNDHIYLASGNNRYGWILDTDDQNNGAVPFRIIKRTDNVDTTVLTIRNQDGKIGIGSSTSPTELLHVFARSTSESAFIRIQSGSGGTNPATESGIKLTESGQYGFQFVHSAVTDLLKVKHQDSNGSVNQDDIMVWHPNGAVQWGVTSRYNFHYNPNTWGYSTNLYNTTTNFWSVNYYFDHEGYVFVTSYGHWTRKDANNSGHAGGNEAFYGWISVDNKEPTDSSLYDNFSGSTSSYNKFHEYQSPDASGAGSWRDFSHTALYKVSAGWHSFSLRVTAFFSSSHYLNINGSGLNGFYIPKHYL